MNDSDDLQPTSGAPADAEAAGTAAAGARPRKRAGSGLSSMLLPELQALAAELGLGSTARLRKGELISAIQERQDGGGLQRPATRAPRAARTGAPRTTAGTAAAPAAAEAVEAPAAAPATADSSGPASPQGQGEPAAGAPRPRRRAASRGVQSADVPSAEATAATAATAAPTRTVAAPAGAREDEQSEDVERRPRARRERQRREPEDTAVAEGGESASRSDGDDVDRGDAEQGDRDGQRPPRDRQRNQNRGQAQGQDRGQGQDRAQNQERPQNQDRGQNRNQQDRNQQDRNQDRDQPQDRGQGGQDRGQGGPDAGLGEDGARRGRFRERGNRRNRNRGDERFGGNEPNTSYSEDDVLVPVAGVLDISDSYGFVRTSGYLAGPNDVYVSLQQVRKYELRRGDAVTGAVKAPREGANKDKYNALVRLDTINGQTPEESRKRPEFTKLTPLYPNQRLRLETDRTAMTTRVIDLVMPIGKGQRALIVSPPKAGKTMVLQAIANAIATNNPECHLMVVLVDERPEEVTDMQRSVKGEVIASTFDRPPTDHTTVAELSIERAKRLVELGHDVVVLLDSITRLGRAYNLAAPVSGRILSGGVDSTALYPPKRFLGAARNIEHGGSLTIIATALVETGSTMDTVIFEEFKGTGNAELKLDRRIADKRVFPAIDVDASGTRKEELLLSGEEMAVVLKLRRVLHALDSQQALDLLLTKMKATATNAEFLLQIQRTTPNDG